ncbi:MAG: dihydrofolate reductase [Lachnospiraceae bacterium]|nr:dihydrofolate reductase [Lachnospiraceae bacterium]
MKEIVNVNKVWGIGRDGDLLVNIPADMKFFRETTRGAVVIMGSTTLDSFPGGAPLKGRVNIVLVDDDRKIRPEAAAAAEADREAGRATELIYVRSLEEAVEKGRAYEAAGREVFVIGGATVYRIMLPYCDTCIVTVNDCGREADTFYPDLTSSGEWEMVSEGEPQQWEGITFRFTVWKRK